MGNFVVGMLALGAFLVLAFAGALFTGLIVMFLWNWVMVDVFAVAKLTYLQAFGLTYLCSILFKSSSGSASRTEQ